LQCVIAVPFWVTLFNRRCRGVLGSVLQGVAVCCSRMPRGTGRNTPKHTTLQLTATHCNTLQHTA